MASKVPVKHDRDQTPLDLQGFLNDLQEWELSTKSTDKKKLKHKPPLASSPQMGDDRISTARVATSGSTESSSRPYPKNFNGIPATSRSFMNVDDDTTVDATSEKELGNEYFKQKKFNEAIDCYSRSIALSPTAVAYANRAMAYLKIKRYREAEEDCTEALNLDDRYIKAYSRRATARKELGKLKRVCSKYYSEFALKLEPDNQEIKKQHAHLKSSYQKDVLNKASAALKNSAERAQKGGICEAKVNGHDSGTNQVANTVDNKGKHPVQNLSVMELENSNVKAGTAAEGQEANSRLASQRNQKPGKQELETSILELASRAASRAMTNAAKDVKPPKSAYEFEVSWRGFSGDRGLEGQLLKVTSPSALPQIFKNSLSAPLLLDIIKCIATFFTDDMDLAVKYLQNLTEVPRLNILLMCLSTTNKAELLQLWDEVFCHEATPIEYAENLDNLRSKYCLK